MCADPKSRMRLPRELAGGPAARGRGHMASAATDGPATRDLTPSGFFLAAPAVTLALLAAVYF